MARTNGTAVLVAALLLCGLVAVASASGADGSGRDLTFSRQLAQDADGDDGDSLAPGPVTENDDGKSEAEGNDDFRPANSPLNDDSLAAGTPRVDDDGADDGADEAPGAAPLAADEDQSAGLQASNVAPIAAVAALMAFFA